MESSAQELVVLPLALSDYVGLEIHVLSKAVSVVFAIVPPYVVIFIIKDGCTVALDHFALVVADLKALLDFRVGLEVMSSETCL